jgi:hypothetical protein
VLFSVDSVNHESAKRKWNYSTDFVKFISGEFKGIVSDYILLEAGALLGTELKKVKGGKYIAINTKPDLEIIARLLNFSISLDPYFQQIYISAQGWLPWYGKKYVGLTNELLNIAGKARKWDWQPLRFEGFNNYYFLENNGKAGELLLRAGQIKNAPPFLGILGARLAQKGQHTETAILLLRSMINGKSDNDPGYEDILDRLKALEGVLEIEESVLLFQKTYGYPPNNLKILLESGFLKKIPDNPYNLPYCINSNAKVFFDDPNCNEKE